MPANIFNSSAQVDLPSSRTRENFTASAGTKAGTDASLGASARIFSKPVRVLSGAFRCTVKAEPSLVSRMVKLKDFRPPNPAMPTNLTALNRGIM